MDVALVRWPEEEARRLELERAGVPRLLCVAELAPPPLSSNLFEDWIRLPADDQDMQARVEGLQHRANAEAPPVPEVNEHGVCRVGTSWVSLPPIEQRIASALLAKPGNVVSRSELASVGWPGEAVNRNALDVHMLRLRRRIEPLGLAIRTVRSRGYAVDVLASLATTSGTSAL